MTEQEINEAIEKFEEIIDEIANEARQRDESLEWDWHEKCTAKEKAIQMFKDAINKQ